VQVEERGAAVRAAISPGSGRIPEPIVISDQNGYSLTTQKEREPLHQRQMESSVGFE
jgi:hypothetical protein